ncbi:MAG: peptidoglycan-binding protein [Solirubrobacterales bacterium]|nr:peptidoglycan-binding protein [Solirubrobacterales bacterium]
MTSKHRRHRTRWITGVGAAVAIAATGTVLVATAGGSTTSRSPVTAGPTATITSRDLVETDDQTGTLGYRDMRDVYNQLSGTVTWAPLAGAVIRQDGLLYQVDGSGVNLFYGQEPMYRPFTSGMSDGPDVGELNRDLRAMGYDSAEAIDVSNVDHFQTATGDAIDRWQKAHGLDQTGELGLGRVVFLPGARRIETVELSVGGPATGSAPGGGAAGSSGTPASYEQTSAVQPVEVAFVRVTNTVTAPAASSPATATTPTTTTMPTTPTVTRVPNVIGDRARAARSALTAAGFTVAHMTTRVNDRGQNGVVLDQRPAGGATANTGSVVTIIVGRYSARSQMSGPSTGTTTMHSSPGLSGGGGTGTIGAGGAGAAGGSGFAGGSGAGVSGASAAGGPAGSGAGASSGGAPSPEPNVALVTTSTDSVVTVQLDASKQTEAVLGERVYVTLPSNAVAQGVITQVGRVAQTSSQSSGGDSLPGNGGNSTSGAGSAPQATIPVTISLRHAGGLGSLDQAPVTVAFALTTTRNALSIPVSALLATAGGGYAVDLVESNGAVSRVPVTPGGFAGGFVQISGPGIAAGMQVRDTSGG